MRFLADLHVHSPFSLATSGDMTFDTLAAWAKIKGLALVGTGDFTHPEWSRRIRRELEPAGNGFFRLKKAKPPAGGLPDGFRPAPGDVHFILSAELSFIYSQGGRVRKIHLVVLAPGLAAVERLNRRLGRIGNIRSNGRPILGLDAASFCRIVADVDPGCLVIPAHVWTPWFSLFGSRSGFDSVEECFGDMTPFIAALETGLSADPRMIRRVSALDRFTAVSNSDAHSPAKLGREANAFETEFSYAGLAEAIRGGDPRRFLYTVELFPEEGKYYADGHRKCGVVLRPEESPKRMNPCPVCGKILTPGVGRRVGELADRPERPKAAASLVPALHLVPLEEIIAEAAGFLPGGRPGRALYFSLIREFGNEHRILTEVPPAEIGRAAPGRLAAGIERVRRSRVTVSPGYDGTYGRIRIFDRSL
ncbi:MAG TPA: endonuclease Q family protein [Candidatus Aminicenantes bacterium]|nr:endonuclease Q family protein [Candidatus Aminicenantes bacterium]